MKKTNIHCPTCKTLLSEVDAHNIIEIPGYYCSSCNVYLRRRYQVKPLKAGAGELVVYASLAVITYAAPWWGSVPLVLLAVLAVTKWQFSLVQVGN